MRGGALAPLSDGAGMRGRAKPLSPIGSTVSGRPRERVSAGLRDERDNLVSCEQLARIVIMRRAALDLSQQDLARRMGASVSTVSRVESGQHATSLGTLKRLGEALDGQALIGFEFGSAKQPKPELAAL